MEPELVIGTVVLSILSAFAGAVWAAIRYIGKRLFDEKTGLVTRGVNEHINLVKALSDNLTEQTVVLRRIELGLDRQTVEIRRLSDKTDEQTKLDHPEKDKQ